MNFLNIVIVGLYYFAKRNIWNFLVILALIGITGIGLYLSADANGVVDGAWWSGMWQNFATEMIGAIFTFALFEMLINANNRQEELTRLMASGDNATASNAVNELRALGYLFDGTLQRKSFDGANLAGVNLASAHLERANMQGTRLTHATLTLANLHRASLLSADLSGATLTGANLSDATLVCTNLSGAILLDADLSGADLTSAIFDSTTVLPDGSVWQADTVIQDHLATSHADAKALQQVDMRTLATLTAGRTKSRVPSRPSVHPKRYLRAKRRAQRR